MTRGHGKAFDIKGFAEAFGEAFDARGFGAAFRSAFDLRNAGKASVAGFRDGADLLTKQIRRAGATVHAGARHAQAIQGQLFLQRLLADVAGGGGAAVKALRDIRDLLRPYNPRIDAIPDGHLPGLVKRIIEDLQKPAAKPEDFAGTVGRALLEAQARVAELAFADAAQVLDAALAQTNADDRERARGRAALLAERGRIARLQLRYLEAAGFYEQAAEVMAFDAPAAWKHTLDLAAAYYAQGDEFGDNAALSNAITVYRSALDLVPRERMPFDWAMAQSNLGVALSSLGERESGTARLEEAVAAYREALKELTHERAASDWAMIQNNLGNALARLAERESGTARLEEAAVAYREALKEYTREQVPLDWAMIQNNLGNALAWLGERESGTARLEEAVAAFRAALAEQTRERVPLQWATTQNNLGDALRALGERESGRARLEQAVTAFRAAMMEWTRERVPLQWATAQNNLGNALALLGERDSGTANLKEAIVAFRAALTERMQERVPLDWAVTQNNLGAALRALGERESGTARWVALGEAVAAIDAAFAVFVESGAARYVEICRANRDRAIELLEMRKAARP